MGRISTKTFETDDGYLCSGTLALCQNLIARSDQWKVFDPGYPGTWTSKPSIVRSRQNWPRHLVFIVYHGHHWTVGHLDQQSSTFHTYNSLLRFPMDLEPIKNWIQIEFGKRFLEGLTFLEKVFLLRSSTTSTIHANSPQDAPQQTDIVNCGTYALVIVACLFNDEPVPKFINPRRYREFFAHHLETGTKHGTLSWSQLKDPAMRPAASRQH